jgi:hypothetical protein
VAQVVQAAEEQAQGVQQRVQEGVLVKYVSTDCSYNSSRSRIAADAPIPEKFQEISTDFESIQKVMPKRVLCLLKKGKGQTQKSLLHGPFRNFIFPLVQLTTKQSNYAPHPTKNYPNKMPINWLDLCRFKMQQADI